MRLITFNSEPLYLLDDVPDFAERFKLTARLLNNVEEGLTDHEGRRATGESLRLVLKYSISSTGAELRTLAAALRAHKNERVACPLWPAAVQWSARASADISGGLKLVIGANQSEVFDSVEPVWPSATDTLVPLVVGYLGGRDLKTLTPDNATFDVELTESSPAGWAIAPSAFTAPAGPQPPAYVTAPRLFPFPLHWDSPKQSFTLNIQRKQVGFTRETVDTVRDVPVARTVEQLAWLNKDDGFGPGKLLRFFTDHGAGASFWVGGALRQSTLTAGIAANASSIAVDESAGWNIGDYVGVLDAGTLTAGLGPITAKASTSLTVTANGNAAILSSAILCDLMLARFDSPMIEIEWIGARMATVRFKARELPPEVVPPINESLGLYIGNLARRAWLYEFTRNFAGTVLTERFTSYETALTYAFNTYAVRKLTHGEIRQGLALDRDELRIDCDGLTVAPLLAAATLRNEVPLSLKVMAVEVTSPGAAANAVTVFTGEVVSASIRGKMMTAKASPGGSRFDRKAPRFYLQPGCNHALFSTGCGLLSSDWVHTASITATAAGFPFVFTLGSLARAGGVELTAANSFAGGWVEIGTGTALQRLPIVASSVVTGAALTITLSRDPYPFPSVSTTVRLYPGCDGRRTTCADRFNNYLNFGGHPFVPASNPTLFKLSEDAGGGKK